MTIEYGFDQSGGFVVRDIAGPWASYSYPTSTNASKAKRNASLTARRIVEYRESDLRAASACSRANDAMAHKLAIRLTSPIRMEVLT